MCEFLFHSVYDSKSLENFEPCEYISESLNLNSTINDRKQFEKKSSPQNNLEYYQHLDEKLTKAFRLIKLPSDWTLLGQNFYLNTGKIAV